MRLLLFRQRNFRNLALEPSVLLRAFRRGGGERPGEDQSPLGLAPPPGGGGAGALGDLVRFGEREAWLFAEVQTELGLYRVEQRLGQKGGRCASTGSPWA